MIKSGSTFWDIGIPQLRPRYSLAQIASANPNTKKARPMPCNHGSVVGGVPLKALVPRQEKDDEKDADPDAYEAGRS